MASERTSPSMAKASRRALPTPACTVGGATFTKRLEEAWTMASNLGFSVFTRVRTRRERPGFKRCASPTEVICAVV
jgi:hypothetical protein